LVELATVAETPTLDPARAITPEGFTTTLAAKTAIATTGASRVGFLQQGVGAVGRTLQDRGTDTIHINDYLSDAQKADIAAGTSLLDVSDAFIAARTEANGREIELDAVTYKINKAITSTQDLNIKGQGNATILDFTGPITGGNYALEAIGSITALPMLGANAVKDSQVITLASAPTLVPGDVFIIYNPTDFSYSGFRSYYRAGEWCEVIEVVGNTVKLKQRLYASYNIADVTLHHVKGPNFEIQGVQIKGTTILGIVNASLCLRPKLKNVRIRHSNNSCVNFDRCYLPLVDNPDMTNVGDGGDDYGVAFGNSQHGRINGGSVYGQRHAVAHGGNAQVGCVPTRDCITRGTVLDNDIDSGVFSADFHGNTEKSSFVDCTINNGGSFAGKDNWYQDCRITNISLGCVVYSREIKGGKHSLINCELYTNINPQPNARAIIDVGGNNVAVDVNTVEDTDFIIQGCTLDAVNMSALTSFFLFHNRGSAVKTNIKIDGVVANVDAMGQVLFTRAFSGTPTADYIIVDNITNFPANALLHNSTAGAYHVFPHRCQKQTGSVTLTATTGTSSTISAPINYKYRYHKAPAAHATSVGGVNGNRLAYAALFSNTGTAIRPLIESGDQTAWTATNDRVVNWTASIDEV
jgi:hypothetical protein